jgi:eukaryotic-like serine/threonine-protein kinase
MSYDGSVPEEFGPYVIVDELGQGGMAQVHLADTPVPGRGRVQVALKRMLPHVAGNEEMRALFLNEAKLAKTLRHPNIAAIHDCGTFRGVPFIAFEFVPGPTVDQLARQCANCVGPIPIPVVLNIACQLCEALHHAHDFGIVHRDVSPQNLIVSNTGLVKLIDFGLAKAKQSTVVSQTGIIKGKLRYVAPEYIAGRLDWRADLWATGVVVYELLTGQRLFDGADDVETVELVREQPIAPPSALNREVSKELDEIVRTCLQREPAKRWQAAATLRSAFVAEAKQCGPIRKPQLVAWVEWAFTQTRRDNENSAVIALNEIVESGQLEMVDDALDHAETAMFRLPAIDAAMKARRRETVSGLTARPDTVERATTAEPPEPAAPRERLLPRSPAVPRTTPAPEKSRRVWWLLIALIMVLAVTGVAAWRLGIRLPLIGTLGD